MWGGPALSTPHPDEKLLATQGCARGGRAAQPSSADVCGASCRHWTLWGGSLVAGEGDSEDAGRTWRLPWSWGHLTRDGGRNRGRSSAGGGRCGEQKSPVSDEIQHQD